MRLWRQYRRGNRRALELLVQYNTADTCNLRALAEAVARRLMGELLQKLSERIEDRLVEAIRERWMEHV